MLVKVSSLELSQFKKNTTFLSTPPLFIFLPKKIQDETASILFCKEGDWSSLSIEIWLSSAKSSLAKSCQDKKGPLPSCAAWVMLKSSKT